MKIDKTDEELIRLINMPTLKDKEISEMMKTPTKEVLNKSIEDYGFGYITIKEKYPLIKLRRSYRLRKSRRITIMVNGKPRVMHIPSERSVKALRDYSKKGYL